MSAAAESPRRCACTSVNASVCFRARYPRAVGRDDDEQRDLDADDCECVCHEADREAYYEQRDIEDTELDAAGDDWSWA